MSSEGVRRAWWFIRRGDETLLQRLRYAADTLLMSYVGGHISMGPVTIYGHNAMHWAINIRTKRYGSVCFRPTTITPFGDRWQWYFYVSPNGTPWAATFAVGPGLSREDKFMAHIRRYLFGHNFNTDFEGFGDWNRATRDEYETVRLRNLMAKDE